MSLAKVFITLMILLSSMTTLSSHAGEPVFSEYEVKAGFVYNFIKLVEWPGKLVDEKRPITLCISGADPFGNSLSAISSRTVHNRKLEVRQLGKSRDFKICDIVFVSSSEKEFLPQLTSILKNSSVVTIGDTGGFAQSGIMINLVIDEDKVKFEINTETAGRAKVAISSKLLKLAKAIYK